MPRRLVGQAMATEVLSCKSARAGLRGGGCDKPYGWLAGESFRWIAKSIGFSVAVQRSFAGGGRDLRRIELR